MTYIQSLSQCRTIRMVGPLVLIQILTLYTPDIKTSKYLHLPRELDHHHPDPHPPPSHHPDLNLLHPGEHDPLLPLPQVSSPPANKTKNTSSTKKPTIKCSLRSTSAQAVSPIRIVIISASPREKSQRDNISF